MRWPIQYFIEIHFSFSLVSVDPSCTQLSHLTNTAMDYALNRFLTPLKVQIIPNTNIGLGMRMTHTRLYGLNTLHRTCPINVVNQPDDSKTFRIKSCIGAGNITLTSTIRTTLPISFFTFVTLTKFDLDSVIGVKLAKGSTAQFESLNVKSMKWKIDFKGVLSPFNPLLNAAANGNIGRAVVRMAKSSIKGEIQKELDKYPL